MVWFTWLQDVWLLREVVAINPFNMTNPKEGWEKVAANLKPLITRGICARRCKERTNFLLDCYKKDTEAHVKNSDTDEICGEKEQLLQEIVELQETCDDEKVHNSDKKKRNHIHEESKSTKRIRSVAVVESHPDEEKINSDGAESSLSSCTDQNNDSNLFEFLHHPVKDEGALDVQASDAETQCHTEKVAETDTSLSSCKIQNSRGNALFEYLQTPLKDDYKDDDDDDDDDETFKCIQGTAMETHCTEDNVNSGNSLPFSKGWKYSSSALLEYLYQEEANKFRLLEEEQRLKQRQLELEERKLQLEERKWRFEKEKRIADRKMMMDMMSFIMKHSTNK